MNTKTLLLLGVFGAAGLTSAVAQTNVYSVNAVGYVNKSIPAGQFAIIANPLTAATNTLAALVPSAPLGTTVYFFRNNNYVISTYELDDFNVPSWSNPSVVALPGEAFWIKNAGVSALNLTFVGDVPTGSLTNSIPSGFSLRSSQVPQSGRLDTVLGFPVALGNSVFLFRNNNYVICTYELDDFNNPAWSTIPVPEVGEGFWVSSATTKDWTRSFTVNN